MTTRYEALRQKAQRQLQNAQTQRLRAMNTLKDYALAIARAERNIRKWDRRVKHYFERTQMTDDQLEVTRLKRARKSKLKRSIKLSGDL